MIYWIQINSILNQENYQYIQRIKGRLYSF